jgi:hypothetical protein
MEPTGTSIANLEIRRENDMGYSHYWTIEAPLEPEPFAAWSADVQAIIHGSEIPIRGGHGEGEPEVTPSRVWINGDGDDSYETFGVALESTGWDFCKTAEKPYDVVVTASLIALADRFPQVEVTSDGGVEDWQPGVRLFERATGRTATGFWAVPA